MAATGYVVACINYRGSAGFGDAALKSVMGSCGDQDVRDCMLAVAACVDDRGWGSRERMCVVGGSHGGFLSCHLTSKPGIAASFKATVMRNPVTDLTTMVGMTDIEDWCIVEGGVGTEAEQIKASGGVGVAALEDGFTAADLAQLWHASPMSNVKHVTAATMMLIGNADLRVPPSQGRAWARQLRQRGRVVETFEYPDNSHPLSAPFADADVWINTVCFLNRHV
jgi:acylaminoacyl-peptidase